MILKMVGGAIAICSLFAIIFGVHEWQDNRYALSEALAQTNKTLEQTQKAVEYHITNQQREALENRVEILKQKYLSKPMTPEAKELFDDLKKRLAEKEKELKKLEKKE